MGQIPLCLLFLLKLVITDNADLPILGIIKGRSCKEIEYPFLVTLREKYNLLNHICGGTLITDTIVLSAANCFFSKISGKIELNVESIKVVGILGMSDIEQAYYPDFNHESHENNIGLLKLKEGIVAERYVNLPKAHDPVIDDNNDRTECLAMGWDKQKPERQALEFTDGLRCANLPIMNYRTCKALYSNSEYEPLKPSQICTLSLDGQDTCSRDSGGPLICKGLQYGVISTGVTCGDTDMGRTHTRIRHYLGWINETIKLIEGNGGDSTPSNGGDSTPKPNPDPKSAANSLNHLNTLLVVGCGFGVTKFL